MKRWMDGISYRALMAPEDGSGSTPEPAAPAPAVDNPAPAAPAVDPAPAAPAAGESPAPAPAADPAAAPEARPSSPDKPAQDFAPSLLDEAAKPTAEPAKPAEPAPDKKDAAKPEDGKPPAEKEPAPAPEAPAPIEYAFRYPEGVKPEDVDAERMGAFTGILGEVHVPAEAGQKLLDLHLGEMARVAETVSQAIETRQWDTFNNTQKQWRDEVMADPEIGGSRHETALRTVMSLVDAYGDRFQGTKEARDAQAITAERKELLDVFRATGAANNRLILGLLHFAGDKLREGTPRPAPPPRGQAPGSQNRGTGRYRNTTPGA